MSVVYLIDFYLATRAADLKKKFTYSVVFSRALDLDMDFDYITNLESWWSFGTVDTVMHGFASFFNQDFSNFSCKPGVVGHVVEVFIELGWLHSER